MDREENFGTQSTFLQTKTKMNKSEKFWDWTSKSYDKQAKDKTYKKTLEITKKHLKSSDIVLDYACATGLYSIELAGNVKEIHGIDISSKMIETAKRKAGKNVNFEKATIFEKYKKETFNVILAFNILHLLEEPQKVMQRINKLLKPEGLLISVTPCLGEKYSFLSVFLVLLRKIRILPYIRSFNISELKELISGNFQIVETGNLPPMNYLIIAKKI
ncbi:MAG: class I SAM-dependent methyltransferase [Euryarchaeota archaeon]|nr:class I SAM-dependent methyltransferase [Euryarchaeota archaeon]